MVKRYHIICIPLYFWGFYEIKTKDQLLSFGHVLARMFRFEGIDISEENEFEDLSILGSRFVWKTEIYNVREITDLVDKNLVDSLDIEHIFITDYSFEIITSNQEIISLNDAPYSKLATEISKVAFKSCYETNENIHLFDTPAIVASLKIITCDTFEEIKELNIEYQLEKVTECFYVNKYNAFNFIKSPWNELFMPELIVILNPKTIAKNMGKFHLTADEFGYYVTLTHAIGKIYAISGSLHSASVNLMITSWNFDEICINLESKIDYIKRKFSNNEIDFYNLFRDFKELVIPLSLLANQTCQGRVFEEEYGPVIGSQIEDSLNMLQSSKAKDFLKHPELITKVFMDDIEMFGEILMDFLDKFQNTINTWREFCRSQINHYQMLGTIIALVIAVVSLIISLR